MDTIDTVKAVNKNTLASTQRFLRISEVRDGLLVLKNGGIRAVLKVSSVNFNLKSEEEQNAIVYSYQNFLNSIEFPIQIVVRSKKLDVDEYVDSVKEKSEKQMNSLLKRQTLEYAEYITKLVEYADIMEKEFFVVVPYNPSRSEKNGIFKQFFSRLKPQDSIVEIKRRHSEFENLKKGVTQRVNVVKTGLEQVGLSVEELSTHKLIELFYKIYNPGLSREQKIDELDTDELEEE